MTLEGLLVIAVALAMLPLAGALVAMVLGVVVSVSRRRLVMPLRPSEIAAMDRLEQHLQGAAEFLGYTVEGVRRVPDRRGTERRERPRRQRARAQTDRRRDDRRSRDRRRLRSLERRR